MELHQYIETVSESHAEKQIALCIQFGYHVNLFLII